MILICICILGHFCVGRHLVAMLCNLCDHFFWDHNVLLFLYCQIAKVIAPANFRLQRKLVSTIPRHPGHRLTM